MFTINVLNSLIIHNTGCGLTTLVDMGIRVVVCYIGQFFGRTHGGLDFIEL